MKTASQVVHANGFELWESFPRVTIEVPCDYKPKVCHNGCICSSNLGIQHRRTDSVQPGESVIARIFCSPNETNESDISLFLESKRAVFLDDSLLKLFIQHATAKKIELPEYFAYAFSKQDNRFRRAGDRDSGSVFYILTPNICREPAPLFSHINFHEYYPILLFTRE